MSEEQPLLAAESETLTAQLSAPKIKVIALLLAVVTLISICGNLVSLPIVRIAENAVCEEYYQEHSPESLSNGRIDEKFCKLDSIQSQLALLLGVEDTIGAFASM